VIDAGLLVTSMPFFSALPARVNAALRERARAVSLSPLANLLQPGDVVNGAYFVAEGSIRIFYLDGEGREGTLDRILSGESCIFALNCLFSDMPYPVWAQAKSRQRQRRREAGAGEGIRDVHRASLTRVTLTLMSLKAWTMR
jgi:CRP/FNR family transcriptional regulator